MPRIMVYYQRKRNHTCPQCGADVQQLATVFCSPCLTRQARYQEAYRARKLPQPLKPLTPLQDTDALD